MKKFLIALIVVVAAVAIALPASTAELKFGGYADTKYYSTNNQYDADDDADDNTNWFRQRARLYFDAVGSEYVKFVSKFEIDNFWGDNNIGSLSADGGSSGQTTGMEVKNIYLNFAIPDTPLSFDVGIFTSKVDKAGFFINDDVSGIQAYAKYDEFLVSLAYARLGDQGSTSANLDFTPTDSSDDVDIWGATIKYMGMEQFEGGFNVAWIHTESPLDTTKDLDLFLISVDADYQTDMFTTYFSGVLNTGTVEDDTPGASDLDFKGYLLALGGTYNLDTVTIGLDFFYASGDDDATDKDIDNVVTINGGSARNTYRMDEVVFPGWFDDDTPSANSDTKPTNTTNLTGTRDIVSGVSIGGSTEMPSNIIAIGAHADMKPLDKTMVQVGLAYMMFDEKVLSEPLDGSATKKDDSLGTSAYLRLSQGIVDGLTLKAAFGYLFADDGYAQVKNDDDAYRIATGLFWSW
jgi:hypothetical protein